MSPRSLLVPFLLLLLLALPATAQIDRDELALSAGRWDSDEIGNSPALGVSLAHYWARMISTRVGALATRDGDFTTTTLHASAELHLFPDSGVSPWVGAGGAHTTTRRAASNDHFTGSDSRLTAIYSGGVDVKVSPRYAVGAEASYMNYELMLGSRYGYRVNPVTVLLTGRVRF